MNHFIGNLDVRLIEDSREGCWELLAPFTYSSTDSGVRLTVPAGFRTDFCSIPRLPLLYLSLGNTARRAGVVHDYIYITHLLCRADADWLLKEMIIVCGMSEVEAHTFYMGVRLGGIKYYGDEL